MKLNSTNFVGKFVVAAVIVALVGFFTPISKGLLHLVNGSFSPTSYSSLALVSPNEDVNGLSIGRAIKVRLTNHRGRTVTYRWSAYEGSELVSQGKETLESGESVHFGVPTLGAKAGIIKISLRDSKIFVTVPLLTSNS